MKYKNLIREKLELGPFVSPGLNEKYPIHRWFSYKHGFSKDLVECMLVETNVSKGSWVLDPFCGSGTTLLTYRDLGINSIGYDVLPFSVFLTNTKLRKYSLNKVVKELESFKKNNYKKDYLPQDYLPDISIAQKAFSKDVLTELYSIKMYINSINDKQVFSIFNLGFLSILESVSNTKKSGGFLRIEAKNINTEQIKIFFTKKIEAMINDLVFYQNHDHNGVFARSFANDARRIKSAKKFDAVITSPPYPNRHDYTRIYTLELIFDFISSNEKIKNLRYNTIRSHVEAKDIKIKSMYKEPYLLKTTLEKLKKENLNNIQVLDMLKGYFEDMYIVLSRIKETLNQNAEIAFVVSNVRYSGINIEVDRILGEIGENVGLCLKNIDIIRYRGNSSQQMKKYSRKPSRESIIYWVN